MTNPRPSPYGPVDSGPPNHSAQPPAASQQPAQYGAPAHQQHAPYGYPAPQQQHGYPMPAQTSLGRSNWAGLASLIVATISLLIAFIPGIPFNSFLPGFVGIVLGGVGLSLAGRPRRQAGWGLALSVASIFFGFVMNFVYTFGNLATT